MLLCSNLNTLAFTNCSIIPFLVMLRFAWSFKDIQYIRFTRDFRQYLSQFNINVFCVQLLIRFHFCTFGRRLTCSIMNYTVYFYFSPDSRKITSRVIQLTSINRFVYKERVVTTTVSLPTTFWYLCRRRTWNMSFSFCFHGILCYLVHSYTPLVLFNFW